MESSFHCSDRCACLNREQPPRPILLKAAKMFSGVEKFHGLVAGVPVAALPSSCLQGCPVSLGHQDVQAESLPPKFLMHPLRKECHLTVTSDSPPPSFSKGVKLSSRVGAGGRWHRSGLHNSFLEETHLKE